MIEEILPLSRIRIDILTELTTKNLMAKEISIKIKRSLQSTFNALNEMQGALNKKQNIYSIKPEVKILLKNFLIRNLLEKRLGEKYYYVLPYIKKHLKPEKMIFFGSYFRGDFDKTSDIDIYIISEEDKTLVKEIEFKLTNLLKKRIQIICVSSEIHLTKKDNFSDLYNSISNDTEKGIEIPLEILEG